MAGMAGTNSFRKIVFLFLLALFVLPLSAEAAAPNAETIRSTTAYLSSATLGTDDTEIYDYLVKNIPDIKAQGFNTLWFVTPWITFDPRPLAVPRTYNEAAFSRTKKILELLRQNNIRAIIGLNYLGTGWSPDLNNDGKSGPDDKACMLTSNGVYPAFEKYVEKFLTEIETYHDMVYPVVFSEASEPCGLWSTSSAPEAAAIFRNTLGNLPNQLQASLRSKYNFGYHDYAILNFGTGNGASPAANGAFDFFSMVAYDFDDLSNDAIAAQIDLRAERFRKAHPNTPLIIGELGASSCSKSSDPNKYDEANQARVLSTAVRHALSRGIGANVWTWPWIEADTTQECPDARLVLMRRNGTHKAVIPALKAVFSSMAPCTFNERSVARGASITAYQRPYVAYGNQCVLQVRTCTNDVLTGTYPYATCTVAPPAGPALSVSPGSGAAPLQAIFTYALNKDFSCDAGSYRFSFGDENWAAGDQFKNFSWKAGVCAPILEQVTHSYKTPGAYQAQLIDPMTQTYVGVSSISVASGGATQTPAPPPSLSTPTLPPTPTPTPPPTATFAASPTSGAAMITVSGTSLQRPSTPPTPPSCVALSANMGGDDTDATTNGDVSLLQKFLMSQSLLDSSRSE